MSHRLREIQNPNDEFRMTKEMRNSNIENIKKWASWAAEPIEEQLLAEVLDIFKPVKNIGHVEGLPKNN